MTWGEFIDSEYNVISASIYELGYISLGVSAGRPILIYDSNYNYVITTQEIIANHNYSAASGGGAGS